MHLRLWYSSFFKSNQDQIGAVTHLSQLTALGAKPRSARQVGMSPSPDTQDSSSSTAVAMSSPSAPQHEVLATRKGASAGMPGGVSVGEIVENPYLAGLSKKTRGLKKKMEKIKKTETLSASGKVRALAGYFGMHRLYMSVCFAVILLLSVFSSFGISPL